ncbi:hypothetical protein BdWA1_001073 [Babesia duncani]|uniref:Uncharacterized protein n=1 Tax=Babesia duncani TaxID=323732 RepID=A0AAD9UQE3_9APIC|nr:hypothetical protein BdWA1_001073 [Babesia duncani]
METPSEKHIYKRPALDNDDQKNTTLLLVILMSYGFLIFHMQWCFFGFLLVIISLYVVSEVEVGLGKAIMPLLGDW